MTPNSIDIPCWVGAAGGSIDTGRLLAAIPNDEARMAVDAAFNHAWTLALAAVNGGDNWRDLHAAVR